LLNVPHVAFGQECGGITDGDNLEADGRIEVREPAIRNAPAGCLADCVIKPTKQLPSDASVPQIVSYPHASQHDDAVLGCQPNCSDDLGARPCCEEFIDRLNWLRVPLSPQKSNDHLAGRADNGQQLWALLTLELWMRKHSFS